MTFLAKFLFVSASWFPVYVLIGVLTWHDHPNAGRLLIAAAFISVITIWMLKAIAEARFAPEPMLVVKVVERKDDLFMYILSYIPPFFAADISSPSKVTALVVLYVLIFITYVRLDQYHLNPVFVLFGYRVYDVEIEGGRLLHLIAKRNQPVSAGQRIRLIPFDDLALVVAHPRQ
jgi:hypothetical protein